MYAFDSRVRFSEADQHETITLPGIINYFQDCSIFHSEDIGVGIDYLKEKKKAWEDSLKEWKGECDVRGTMPPEGTEVSDYESLIAHF